MKHGHTEDKQLKEISLEAVMEKRRLDQALNAKEFAVCAGVSDSTARDWFRLPGFPAFRGVIFWQDFVHWRAAQNGFKPPQNMMPIRPPLHQNCRLVPRKFFWTPKSLLRIVRLLTMESKVGNKQWIFADNGLINFCFHHRVNI